MRSNSQIIKLTEFLNKGAVVVIEPNDNYRKTLKRYLENLKTKEVKIYEGVSEARLDLKMIRASVLIVEWAQKGENGLQFCRDLRKDARQKETPFLLMSTESLRGDVVLASEVGIDGYLVKPFSYEDFCDQLTSLIGAASERVKYTRLVEKAEVLLEQEQYEEAERLFSESRTYRPQSARVQTGIGLIRLANGLEEEAIEIFKDAILINENYLEAYKALIDIFTEREQAHHVLHYGLKAHDLSPENPRYMLSLAKAYLLIEDLENSEKYFRMTIRISPSLAAAHKGLGDVKMLQEEYDQAMGCYQKALDLDGEDVSILNSMGLVYIKQEKYEEGMKKYKLALGVEPENAKVLFNLGYAYEKTNDLEAAKDCYNRALISDPDYTKPHRGLARLASITKNAG